MADIGIFRPATEDEKKDFIEITKNRKSVMNLFLARLADKQLYYQRKHIPFCAHCARLDFDKKIQDAVIDAQATAVSKTAAKTTEENLDNYAGVDRFELLDKTIIRESKLLDGLKTTAITGQRFTFKCKNRGCGLVMDIENEELEEALKVLEPKKAVVTTSKVVEPVVAEDKKEEAKK